MGTSVLIHAAPLLRNAGWILGALALLATVGWSDALAATPPPQGRSMVATRYGIVATSQVLASRAGAQVLELGGSATDAAIAANAVLGVVEPMSDGIGGDLFALVYEAKTGKVHGLNASGWAPAAMTLASLRGRGLSEMPEDGILSVTVPGCVAGWDALRRRFGKLPFQTLLASAIRYAQEGFPVTERISTAWKVLESRQNGDPELRRVYVPGGRAPGVGDLFRNPDLATSLERIAARGRDGFYKGPTAKAIVELSRRLGGTLEAADLAELQAEWVAPISTTYRGWKVHELPPNGQGIAALMMLGVMEQFPLAEYGHGSARALHVMIEAKKQAYADLLRYVADPRFADVPVAGMLSREHAKARAKEIDPARAKASVVPTAAADLQAKRAGDTVYLTAIDREGNIVSLIQSVYSAFGAKLVAPGTGFALQNRGALFSLDPAHPNVVAPRKRPLHTIIPAFMEKGDVKIGFGIMGGWNQAQAHAQFVSDVVDFGMNIQAALEAPRFTKLTFDGLDVQIEPRVPEATRAELTRLGHQLQVLDEPFSPTVGGGQAVLSDGRGVHFGASDPRKDGAADPEAPPVPGKASRSK
ncbi:MAG TPA: gamma-glutamyltransferase [Myxococcaceae bacterium]|nr:gamma-glutamyltransferase [Myxococcaceae bacterium]